jgi:hypothetical protein
MCTSQIEPGCPDDLEISDAEMMADVARADATWPDPAPEQDEPAVLQLVADIAEADPGADPAEAGELLREAVALALRLLDHLGELDPGAENHGGNGQADALVQLVADRLEVGRLRYGPLRVADDPRDWNRETLEELADACVYLAAEVMRRKGAVT